MVWCFENVVFVSLENASFDSPHDGSSVSLRLDQDCDVGNKITRSNRNMRGLDIMA